MSNVVTILKKSTGKNWGSVQGYHSESGVKKFCPSYAGAGYPVSGPEISEINIKLFSLIPRGFTNWAEIPPYIPGICG